MPRQIDHEQRHVDIIEATLDVLAEKGTRGLSFRAVADKLGGSTTLITHYFPTQNELLDAVSASVVERWDEEIRALDAESDDPRERLHKLLIWLVPSTATGLRDERSRINLVSGQILGVTNRAVFEKWDRVIRGFLRNHLSDLVPAESLDETIDILRVGMTGITLSAVERPDEWPAERQLALVDSFLARLGLAPA